MANSRAAMADFMHLLEAEPSRGKLVAQGAFLGFRKAFLKAPYFLLRFSGMFSGNVTQGIARASIF